MKDACRHPRPQHAAHPRCRPGKTSVGTKALQLRRNGRWAKDNGDPGLAFIGIAAGERDAISATVWVAYCQCKEYRKCPLARALAKAPDEGYVSATVVRKRQARGRKIDRVHRRVGRRRKRR
jgi:hypothetical protein